MKTDNTRTFRVMKTGNLTENQEVGDEGRLEAEVGPVGVEEMGGEMAEGKAPPKLKRLSRRMNRMTIRTTMTKVRMRRKLGRENGNQK